MNLKILLGLLLLAGLLVGALVLSGLFDAPEGAPATGTPRTAEGAPNPEPSTESPVVAESAKTRRGVSSSRFSSISSRKASSGFIATLLRARSSIRQGGRAPG